MTELNLKTVLTGGSIVLLLYLLLIVFDISFVLGTTFFVLLTIGVALYGFFVRSKVNAVIDTFNLPLDLDVVVFGIYLVFLTIRILSILVKNSIELIQQNVVWTVAGLFIIAILLVLFGDKLKQ